MHMFPLLLEHMMDEEGVSYFPINFIYICAKQFYYGIISKKFAKPLSSSVFCTYLPFPL